MALCHKFSKNGEIFSFLCGIDKFERQACRFLGKTVKKTHKNRTGGHSGS